MEIVEKSAEQEEASAAAKVGQDVLALYKRLGLKPHEALEVSRLVYGTLLLAAGADPKLAGFNLARFLEEHTDKPRLVG